MSDVAKREWYLLTSKLHKDKVAEENLRNQHYEVYRPIVKRLRTQRGKLVEKEESLFPRYMFICLDDGTDDNWAPIRFTKGVRGLVRFGLESKPIPMPEEEILGLRLRESALRNTVRDLDHFHKGDKVIITEGAYQGISAVFDQYDGEQRVFVLFEFLHKVVKLPISPTSLTVF